MKSSTSLHHGRILELLELCLVVHLKVLEFLLLPYQLILGVHLRGQRHVLRNHLIGLWIRSVIWKIVELILDVVDVDSIRLLVLVVIKSCSWIGTHQFIWIIGCIRVKLLHVPWNHWLFILLVVWNVCNVIIKLSHHFVIHRFNFLLCRREPGCARLPLGGDGLLLRHVGAVVRQAILLPIFDNFLRRIILNYGVRGIFLGIGVLSAAALPDWFPDAFIAWLIKRLRLITRLLLLILIIALTEVSRIGLLRFVSFLAKGAIIPGRLIRIDRPFQEEVLLFDFFTGVHLSEFTFTFFWHLICLLCINWLIHFIFIDLLLGLAVDLLLLDLYLIVGDVNFTFTAHILGQLCRNAAINHQFIDL